MGDYGPLARETSNPAPGVAPVIDAIALEERLKVARELRAEAIARRQGAGSDISPQSGAQTCPLTGMEDGPPLRPVDPDPAAQIPAAPPLHAACRPARLPSLDPSRQNARAPQVAHPLVALLALGLSVSVVLSRGAPETPASLPVRPAAVEATAPIPSSPVPTQPPAAERLTAPADFKPASGVAPASPAAPAAAPDREPADVEAAPPDPAQAQIETAAPASPPEPPAATEAPVAPAPRREQILVNAPAGVAADAIDAALAALRATGFAEVADQPTPLTISKSSVRYYNAEDAAAAAEIAALVAPFLPGGVAEARDFTEAPSRAAPGHLEIWVAGASPRGGNAARAPAPVVDAAAIRRLVDSVRAEPAIDDFGRGVTDAARGLETGAERVARQIDAAVGGAVRAIEGRP